MSSLPSEEEVRETLLSRWAADGEADLAAYRASAPPDVVASIDAFEAWWDANIDDRHGRDFIVRQIVDELHSEGITFEQTIAMSGGPRQCRRLVRGLQDQDRRRVQQAVRLALTVRAKLERFQLAFDEWAGHAVAAAGDAAFVPAAVMAGRRLLASYDDLVALADVDVTGTANKITGDDRMALYLDAVRLTVARAAEAEADERRAATIAARHAHPEAPPEPARTCAGCHRRPPHFGDLCKRCAQAAGVRPTGKV